MKPSRGKLAFAVSILSIASCAALRHPSSVGNSNSTQTPHLLPAPETLTKEFFAKNAVGIPRDMFEERWNNSLESPLTFFRSHVRAYYDITKDIVLPISITAPCLGDAHVANFGFVEGKDNQARFLYNDLDDSGICPVALDALRYFTSLRLRENQNLIANKISLYTNILNNHAEAIKIEQRFEPNFQELRAKILNKFTANGKIIRKAGILESTNPTIYGEISEFVVAALASEKQVATVRDVVLASGRGGGSFGLTRYWVLVNSNQEDIVEVKEAVEPATALGGWGTIPGDRLETLKQIFWGGDEAARIYRQGNALQKSFLVRSRVKASLEPEEYDLGDRETIYNAQVSLMAQAHKKSLTKASAESIKALKTWLNSMSQELSTLYVNVYNQAK
jgi:hypothetical protein